MFKLGKWRAPEKSILFFGHSYYHNVFLAKELRKLGWRAHTLNPDPCEENQFLYFEEDFRFAHGGWLNRWKHLWFYIKALFTYRVFHFSAAEQMRMLPDWDPIAAWLRLPRAWEILLLKKLKKVISYANNSCKDGVLQSTFAQLGPYPTCDWCKWQRVPTVCSDPKSNAWGRFRNRMADVQILNDGNFNDFNRDKRVHFLPSYYCLDPSHWDVDIPVPSNYLLPFPEGVVKIYHSVSLFNLRTSKGKKNIKCTHLITSLVERLKREGHPVELIFFHDVPSKKIRYYQMQADIVIDMLTYGHFGANIREALMLGKPSVCFLRKDWLDAMSKAMPAYVEDMPIVNANPDNVYDVVKELVINKEKRRNIGLRSREFALKWHSAEIGAKAFSAHLESHGLPSM